MCDTRRPSLKLATFWVLALGMLITAVAPAETLDITNQFAVARSGLVMNRQTNTFDATITLTNTSNTAVLAPITVVVGGLPSGVTLANQTGQRADGKPYVTPMLPEGQLPKGGTLSFVLHFANPQRVTITSTLQILYTVPPPASDAPSLIRVVAGPEGTNASLIGRVDSTSNLPITITLQAYSASSCFLGTLISGAAAGGPIAVTTDAAGYFGVNISGVNPGDFVAVNVVSPTASPLSTCLVSSSDNDSWPKASSLRGDSPTGHDFIDAPGKARWYKFSVTPGQRIQISLSNLPQDYTLAVFKDICQAFLSPLTPDPASPLCTPDTASLANTASPPNLLKLTAESAPSVWSPSVWSPSLFSPDAYPPSQFDPSPLFSPSVWSPSVWSPSVWSPSVWSPSVWSPSAFSPSVWSPSLFCPSVFLPTECAQTFSAAQTRSVIGVSATPGSGDKSVVVNSWNNTGNFYVRVTGRGDAFDTATPFTLTVTKDPTTCAGVTDTTITTRPLLRDALAQTVILTDSSDPSKFALDADLPGGGTLRDKLSAFAARPEINGVLVDIKDDARIGVLKQQAAANPACPFAMNLVAQEIKGIVDSYRSPSLRYVVIVGNDTVIPFFRSPDLSGLADESGYVPPVQSDSTSDASLRQDFVLSQDGYGSNTSIALPWGDFPVPGLAVGRLVETPAEIAGVIDAAAAVNWVVRPTTSLVTGYDFLAQPATAVMTELQAGMGAGGVTDTLITPDGVSPQDPQSWTATDLANKLFGRRHDIIFLAGHFSANNALAADFSTSIVTTDLVASTVDLSNAIVFSAGCHSGYNLVDTDAVPGVTLPLDWAQAFARKKATLIAGTGYQYGDTDFIEYSARLYDNFAGELLAGTGPVAVGEALVKAKLDYMTITPDIRGIHEKTLREATLFGLPMLSVNMPAGRQSPPGGTSVCNTLASFPSGPAQQLGLMTCDLNRSPALTSHSVTLKNVSGGADVNATYWSGPDSHVVTKPGEPVLPLDAVNVTPNDPALVLRGVGFRGGTYADSGPTLPLSDAPATELRGVHVPFLSPVFYPARLWTPNYFAALAQSGGGTKLLVTPVQHRAARVADGTSTERVFSSVDLRLYYSGNLSQAALSQAPSIVDVAAQTDPGGGGVLFTAQVVGDPAAAIAQVWVTYTGDGAGAWASLDLAQCVAPLPAACTSDDSRLWKGHLASPPTNLKYTVQAVNGVGLVALDDNRGAYYAPDPATPAATMATFATMPSMATVGDTVSVTTRLTFVGVALPERTVTVSVGGIEQIGTTGLDGTVTVRLPINTNTGPGTYQLTVSFAGDDNYQASSTTTSLVVTQAASMLTPPQPPLAPLGAVLTGVLGGRTEVLQQEPVSFTANGPNGQLTIWSITDYLGHATLPPPGLPAGDYTVTQASYSGNATYMGTNIALSQQFTVPRSLPILVASHATDDIREFEAATGAFIRVVVPAGTGGLQVPEGMAVGPDGTLYVASGGVSLNGAVLRFDVTSGNFLGTVFTVSGVAVGDLAFATNGHLLLQESVNANQSMSGVGEYDVTTGTLVRFITTGCCPNFTQMGFGPNGNLYVALEGQVSEYDFTTGAAALTFAPSTELGGGSSGLSFSPDGRLLVGTYTGTIQVLQYNPTTGQEVAVFIPPGLGALGTAGIMKFGPDGDVYVLDYSNSKIVRFNGTTGALVATIPIALANPSYLLFLGPPYVLTTVDVPGSTFTQLEGINNLGQIGGGSDLGPFIYQGGHFNALPAPPAGISVFAFAISDAGTIVGNASNSATGFTSQGFILSGGTYSFFSHPGYQNTEARGINLSGLVVGDAYSNDQTGMITSSTGFIYNPSTGAFTDILPGHTFITQGINAAGQVVGDCIGGPCVGSARAFLRDPDGTITPLTIIPPQTGFGIKPRAINDRGLMAGHFTGPGNVSLGFVGSPASFQVLAVPGAVQGTLAQGLNNLGVVTGWYVDVAGNTHGFIATPGTRR